MNCCLRKLARFFECNRALNKKAICMKRSWDEVSAILDKACFRRRHRGGSCKRH